jgi:hypothetical protein
LKKRSFVLLRQQKRQINPDSSVDAVDPLSGQAQVD